MPSKGPEQGSFPMELDIWTKVNKGNNKDTKKKYITKETNMNSKATETNKKLNHV